MKSARFAPLRSSLSAHWPALKQGPGLLVGATALSALLLGCPDKVGVEIPETQDDGFAALVPEDEPEGTQSLQGCAFEAQGAEQRPVSMYMMLDSSVSMEEETSNGSTKWQSIQRALRTFLSQSQGTDLSIGLQFFPLLKPGSKYFCETNEDCGPEGGLCYLQTCSQGEEIVLCSRNSDCPGVNNNCVTFGLCEETQNDDRPLACLLGPGSRCEEGKGSCVDFERTCEDVIQCDSTFYSAPAVEIGTIAERTTEIDQALSGQLLEGLTPTVPALEGALAHAREYALAHPERTVVTVLATDGTPTECGAEGSAGVAEVMEVAAAGLAGSPSIRTVVFGVFAPDDDFGRNSANRIARAGGTEQAVVIDTSADVSQQFVDALQAVQTSTLACEFQIPESDSQLDYFKVNLTFNDGTTRDQLSYVDSAGACEGTTNRWHYDIDPRLGQPTRIEVCPDVCQRFQQATEGDIQLQLGCATILR